MHRAEIARLRSPAVRAPAIFKMSIAMNDIIPLHFGSSTVRLIVEDGVPWFFLDDIRSAVRVESDMSVTDRLHDDEKTVAEVDSGDAVQDVVVVNQSGLYAVATCGERALAGRLKRWITVEVLPTILPAGSAMVWPPRPRDGVHSTSEIADDLGVHASTLGRRVKHLKAEAHGERHPAVGQTSEAVVERWWWNEAGRDAVLREFRMSAECPARRN